MSSKKIIFLFIILMSCNASLAQDTNNSDISIIVPAPQETAQNHSAIFDDEKLIAGYTVQYSQFPKETVIEMLKDDTLTGLRSAAAARAFKEKYSAEIVSREKKIIEKILLRRLNRGDTPYVKTELMETLCQMDRYRYFGTMVPALIQKLDHYNPWVNQIAYKALVNITVNSQSQRAREARIVFNILRKVLFLSRNRLKNVTTPDERLTQKLTILRWSIKILGTEELKYLPKEVINLL